MIKKERILTIVLLIAACVQLIGCSNNTNAAVSESTKVFQGTIVEINKERVVISPDHTTPERDIATQFNIDRSLIEDEQTNELLSTLIMTKKIAVYYNDILNIGNDANLNHVYRIEKVNTDGTTGYGETELVPRALLVNGQLYTDTGIITDETHTETPSGIIEGVVENGTLPTEENTSNFGSGYKYWVITETSLHVNVNGKMTVFKLNDAKLPTSCQLTIYTGNSDNSKLKTYDVSVEALNADIIIRELRNEGVITNKVIMNYFKKNGASLQIDFNKELINYAYQHGQGGEEMIVGGIVNTFLDAYGATEITITVNGDSFEITGKEYEEPLTWYGEPKEED